MKHLKYLRAVSATFALALCTQVNAGETIADGLTLEAGFIHVEGMTENGINISSPSQLKLTPDKKSILFDTDEFVLKKLSADDGISVTNISYNDYPENDLTAFREGGFLLTNPLNGTIIQITADLQPHLYAGSRKQAQQRDAEMLTVAVSGDVKPQDSQSLDDAQFAIPIDVLPIENDGWIIKDGFSQNLFRFIDKNRQITIVKGLDELADVERIMGLVVEQRHVYAFSGQEIYKIALDKSNTTAKVVDKWVNEDDGKQQFFEIKDVAVSGDTVLAVDREAGAIIELLAGGKSHVLYQSPCSSTMLEKNDYACAPTKQDKGIPYNIEFNSIIKNPWRAGYIVSDSRNHLLYRFVDGRLSVLAGEVSPKSTLTDQEKQTFVSGCWNLTIKHDNKYCINSNTSYWLNSQGQTTTFQTSLISNKASAIIGKTLYILDFDSIYKLNLATGKYQVWGAKNDEGFQDGKIADAKFANPSDMVLADDGNFYIADYENRRIRKVAPEGDVTTAYTFENYAKTATGEDCDCDLKYKGLPTAIASKGKDTRIIDFAGFVYDFNFATGKVTELFKMQNVSAVSEVALDKQGNLWFIDNFDTIYRATLNGDVAAIIVNPKSRFFAGQKGKISVALPALRDLEFDAEGNLWIATETGLLKLSAEKINTF